MLSGVAVIEATPTPGIKAKPERILLYTIVEGGQPSQQRTYIKADGTFQVTGLTPGKVRMFASGMQSAPYQLLRIERGSGEVKEELMIAKGEKINDLRLIFVQGSGVIRGQVQITGGQLPKGWHLGVMAQRSDNSDALMYATQVSATVDDRGRFVLERLFTGDYELTIYSERTVGNTTTRQDLREAKKQSVIVTNGAEVQVIFQFELKTKEQSEKQ